MQDVAEEAGVNKALLHYYFRSKERLAEEVFLRAAKVLFPKMLETLASDLPLREKLDRAVDLEIDQLTANPFLPGYILAELQYRPKRLVTLLESTVSMSRMQSVVTDSLQKQLDAEAAAGRLRPTKAADLMVALMSQLIFPFVASPMLQLALGLDAETQAEMTRRRRETLADSILRSLRP